MVAPGIDHLHALMAQLEGVFKERGTPALQTDASNTSAGWRGLAEHPAFFDSQGMAFASSSSWSMPAFCGKWS